MSRSCPALLVLLGLASPAPAQTPDPAVWTLALGEYTVFGHTSYNPTVVVRPRIVYDTTAVVDSARVVDSVLVAVRKTAGLAAGMSAWPENLYCTGPASATMEQLDPRVLLGRIQLAARCGVRLMIVPPRRLLTTNGQGMGLFSVDSARRLVDRYAAVLPADTLRKYRATILGLNLADDYTCTACWGGRAITQLQLTAWAGYARTHLPGLPLGVRVTPDWVAAYPALAPVLDYTWAQYQTRKGDARAYFDGAAAIAGRLGLRVVMGVNVEDCDGPGTGACSAADLERYGTMAVSHPASCAFLNWRYDEATWGRPEIQKEWQALIAMARERTAMDCRRT